MSEEPETKVFQIRRTIIREEDDYRLIFEKVKDEWLLHTPSQARWNVSQLHHALKIMSELNREVE